MKRLLSVALVLSMLYGCGSSGKSGTESGTPDPATGYCTSGMIAIQINAGDVGKSRVDFNAMFANPDIGPVETPGHVLDVIGASNQTSVKYYIDEAYKKKLSGWEVGARITTEFGHWVYIDALYPTDGTGKKWHLVCVQTRRDNFGQRISFDVDIVTDKNGVDIDKIVSGQYAGLEISEYFILKP